MDISSKYNNAYEDILEVLKKHEEFIKDDYTINIIKQLEFRIETRNVIDMFDIRLDISNTPGYIVIDRSRVIARFGKVTGRNILISDDGRQPENEWLYCISFPTGAYIFGDEYPKKTFDDFFNELKSFEPKYVDTANKSLYFSPEHAKFVHNTFKVIFDKYRNLVQVEMDTNRIIDLELELKRLKNKTH